MLEEIINNLPDDGVFVDFACGQGSFLFELEKKAKEMGKNDMRFIGFDPNPNEVRFARKLNEENDVEIYWGGNITDTKDLQKAIHGLGLEKVHGVGLNHVLFFFPDDKKVEILKNMNQILEIEGQMVLTIRESPEQGMKNGPYIYDISREELSGAIESVGFFNMRTVTTEGTFGPKKESYQKATSLSTKGRELELEPETHPTKITKLGSQNTNEIFA